MYIVLPICSLNKGSEVFLVEKDALTIITERSAIELRFTVQVRVTLDPLGQTGLGLSLIKIIEAGAGTRDHISM